MQAPLWIELVIGRARQLDCEAELLSKDTVVREQPRLELAHRDTSERRHRLSRNDSASALNARLDLFPSSTIGITGTVAVDDQEIDEVFVLAMRGGDPLDAVLLDSGAINSSSLFDLVGAGKTDARRSLEPSDSAAATGSNSRSGPRRRGRGADNYSGHPAPRCSRNQGVDRCRAVRPRRAGCPCSAPQPHAPGSHDGHLGGRCPRSEMLWMITERGEEDR